MAIGIMNDQLLIPHKTLIALHKLITRRLSASTLERAESKLTPGDKRQLVEFVERLTTYLLALTPRSSQLYPTKRTFYAVHALQPTNVKLVKENTTPRAKPNTLSRTLDQHPNLQPDPELVEFAHFLEQEEMEAPYKGMLEPPKISKDYDPSKVIHVEDKTTLEDLTTPDWTPSDDK